MREVARSTWPCLIMVFARNCAKLPKPTTPILRILEGAERDDETDIVSFVLGRERQRERGWFRVAYSLASFTALILLLAMWLQLFASDIDSNSFFFKFSESSFHLAHCQHAKAIRFWWPGLIIQVMGLCGGLNDFLMLLTIKAQKYIGFSNA